MDNERIRIFSEELRKTKKMVVETRRMADAAWEEVATSKKQADAASKQADAAMRKADAAWELVVITRNQVKEELAYMRLPWWKKIFGMGNGSL